MKVLHVFNRHRSGGGSDNAWDATIALSRRKGLTVTTFERDSRALGNGIGARMTAFANGLYPPGTLRAFAAQLAADRPDIVHTHELYPLVTPWIFDVCARAGVPVVHSCYDFRITCPVATHHDGARVCTDCHDRGAHRVAVKDCRGSLPESIAFGLRHAIAARRDVYRRHVARFIVLTDFSRDWLVDRVGVDPARITINPCIIAAAAAPVDPALGRYAGYAGRFVPEKGIDLLLDAAATTHIPTCLAGPRGSDPGFAQDRGVRTIVTTGPDDLARFYRACRFLVVPSRWFETFAIVAAEAMAHGVPVIAARIGALRDTVREGITGLHFAPDDAADLAIMMRRLWDDDALCRTLGAQGYRMVRDRYSEDAHFATLVAAYDAAMVTTARSAI